MANGGQIKAKVSDAIRGLREEFNSGSNDVTINVKPKVDTKEIQKELDKEQYSINLDMDKIARDFKKIKEEYDRMFKSDASQSKAVESAQKFMELSKKFINKYGASEFENLSKSYSIDKDAVTSVFKQIREDEEQNANKKHQKDKQRAEELKNKKKQDNKETAAEIDKQNELNSKKEIARIITENKLRLTQTKEYFDEEANLKKTRSIYENGKGFTLTTETGENTTYDVRIDKVKRAKALVEQLSETESKSQDKLKSQQDIVNKNAEDYYVTLLKIKKVKEEILKEGQIQEVLGFQSEMSSGASKGQQLSDSNQIVDNLKKELSLLEDEKAEYEEIYETTKKQLVNEDLRRDIEAKISELVDVEAKNRQNFNLSKAVDVFSDKELKKMNSYELSLSKINGRLNKYRQTKEVLATKDTAAELQILINKYKDFIIQLERTDPQSAEFAELKKNIVSLGSQIDNTKNKLEEMNQGLQTQGKFLLNLRDSFKTAIRSFTTYLSVTTVVYAGIRTIRNMVKEVTELDTALVELRKVTNLTNKELNEFKREAFEIAEIVGRTGSEVLNAEAEFARAGFGEGEIANLAETAIILTNVGDGIDDVTSAASSMISVLKAFKMEASESMHIIDALNEVSNNFAVDASNLTMVLERVSGTIAQTGTSYEELIGLTVGGYETLRNAEMVASGLNMISQRMRGMKEDGEAIEGLIPKIEKALQKYTGGAVSMVDNVNGGLRSTYDVLRDLAKIYPTLSSEAKAYLNEVLAGNRQNKVLVAIMENWEDVEAATKTATQSTGSALKENEKYLDSIAGKTAQLKNKFQELSDNLINSGLVKFILDLMNAFMAFANTGVGQLIIKITVLTTAVMALSAAFSMLKKSMVVQSFTQAISGIKDLIKYQASLAVAEKYGIMVTGKQAVSMLGFKGTVDAVTKSLAAQTSALMSSPLFAVGAFAGVLYGEYRLIKWYDDLTNATKNYQKAMEKASKKSEEATNKYEESNNKLTEAEEELKKIQDRIEELEKKSSLTFTEKDELESLKRQNVLLNSQLSILKQINDEKLKELNLTKEKEFKTAYTDKKYGLTDDEVKAFIRPTPSRVRGPILSEYDNKWEYLKDVIKYYDLINEKIEKNYALSQNEKDAYNQLKIVIAENIEQIREMLPYLEGDAKKTAETIYDSLYKSFAPNEYKQMKISEFLDTEEGKKVATILRELSTQGKITEATITALAEKFPELDNFLSDSGITASEWAETYQTSILSTVGSLTTLIDKYGDLEDKINILKSAQEEYNDTGKISIETFKNLVDNDLLDYIEVTGNGIRFNTKALLENADALKDNMREAIKLSAAEQILAIVNADTEESTNNAEVAASDFANTLDTTTQTDAEKIASNIGLAASYDAVKAAANGEGLDTSKWDTHQKEIQDILTNASKQLSAIDKLGSGMKSSSSSSSSKEWWEKELDAIKKQFDNSEITIDEYINRLQALQGKLREGSDAWKEVTKVLKETKVSKVEEDYKKGAISLEEYIKRLKELLSMYKEGSKAWNELASKIKSAQKELLESYKSQFKAAHDAASKALDDEIDRLEKAREETEKYYDERINALKEANDEQNKAIELEKAMQALEKAKNEKTKRVWHENIGWVWEADEEAIKEAEKNLNDIVTENAIDDLEKEKDEALKVFDDQIDAIEKYKDSWEDITEDYENQQARLQAAQIMGANWERDILGQRLTTLEDFRNRYNALLAELGSYDNRSDANIALSGNVPQFSNGGKVDFTGMAMLHGSPSSPEWVLNNTQMENFIKTLNRPRFDRVKDSVGQSLIYNYSFDKIVLPNVTNTSQFINALKNLNNVTNNQ